jgi:hypothetical protein
MVKPGASHMNTFAFGCPLSRATRRYGALAMKSSVSVIPLIAVVDDGESVCEAIKELLAAAGFDAEA